MNASLDKNYSVAKICELEQMETTSFDSQGSHSCSKCGFPAPGSFRAVSEI